MGNCPRCGAWIDAGEPYCPECGYVEDDDDFITIDDIDYDARDVEMVLRDYGYDLLDLEADRIDEDDWEDILDDLDNL